MSILISSDKTKYFSEITATSDTLDGILAVAQSLCEGVWGANRPLEQISHTEILQIHQAAKFCTLSRSPLISITTVQVRYGADSWQRYTSDWYTLTTDEYTTDTEDGRINFRAFGDAKEAKVTYIAGFDFTDTDQEIVNIKAIAGRVASYINSKAGLGVANFASTDSTSYMFDTWLKFLLTPLKKYRPRSY